VNKLGTGRRTSRGVQ